MCMPGNGLAGGARSSTNPAVKAAFAIVRKHMGMQSTTPGAPNVPTPTVPLPVDQLGGVAAQTPGGFGRATLLGG